MAICNGAKCRNREQEMSIKAKSFLPCLFSLYVLVVLLPLFLRVDANKSSSDAYTTTCNGSVGDCNEEVEMLMQSEISRRFLAQNQRIGYGSLKSDQPVCGRGANGQSYSGSCLPRRSNSPKRGCFKIYRCPPG
ncbi:Ralf-like [Thalictrum thalictroides]|uniref:Ralf-like n=1 Tax=Thalictrum thalictroides TaxID=46969 RepID=A0A7J6X6Q1_THATH|nr:Ralf-like [Thalictrum thalictroides]